MIVDDTGANHEELENPPSDLILLSVVNRPAILQALRSRFFKDEIYTNVGAILVSINPFKKIPSLYSNEIMQEFSSTVSDRPHVFAICQNAYDGLKRGKNQSLIISGESGAGKTEATKQALSYLAHVAGSTSGVQEKILLSSPILEAWGNAKTNRNDNSSRFGKFIEVWFGKYSDIIGASVTTYLLEKSRVVFQEENERNYHVFYQLLFGAEQRLLDSLKLTKLARDPNSIALINQSGCIQMESIDDQSDYSTVCNALRSLDFTEEDILNMSKIVAGVINIGNVDILPPATSDRCTMADHTVENFENAVQLWSVDVDIMTQAMFVRTVAVKSSKRSSFVLTPLSHAAALENKNSLAKEIYNRCFDWIVDKLNVVMRSTSYSMGSIGVLDIFGFEIFAKNSLEQLCINLANEALQQHFNYNIFQAEMEFYRSEDIAIPNLEYSDNQDVLDLIMKRSGGLIALLDEEGVVPNGTSEGFLNKITKAHGSSKRFITKTRTREFGVRHYAGDVTYDPSLFLSKNKDTISQDIIEAMRVSDNPFIAMLFADPAASSTSVAATKDASKSTANPNTNKQTVGRKFTIQLEALMATLNKTQPHYIRCIKSNQTKKPNIFDSESSNEQLTYSGIFEAVIIMQNGYPFRLPLSDFLKRYHMLVLDSNIRKNEIFSATKSETSSSAAVGKPKAQSDKSNLIRSSCDALVRHAARVHSQPVLNECHVGKTVVLYKSAPHKCLERLRHEIMTKSTLFIQRFFRGSIIRLLIKRIKAKEIECLAAIERCHVVNMRQCGDQLRILLIKLQAQSRSPNIKVFPIVAISKDYANALVTEKQNEDTIHRLLSNTAVNHVIASIDELCRANEEIKKVVYSANLDGMELRRVWSDNPKLVEADHRIRRYKTSIDMRNMLTIAVQKRDDMQIEDLMAKIEQLREQRELASGYCSDEEKKGLKIVNEAKAAFNELLAKSIVSLTNGELVIKRRPDNNDLEVQVSSGSISQLYNTLSALPEFSRSNNSNTRAKLLLALCKYIKEMRECAEKKDWKAVERLLQHGKVLGGHVGLSNALEGLNGSNGEIIYLYSPPEVEESIFAEIIKYQICVVQFLLVAVVNEQLKQSPAQQKEFSLDIPSSYIASLAGLVDLLSPMTDVFSKDSYLKLFKEVLEIRESLWKALFEGNVINIRNAMASLKHFGYESDPDYDFSNRQLQMHSLRESIHRSLVEDGPTGSPGDMVFAAISAESMSPLLAKAASLSVQHPLWIEMIQMCQYVNKLRSHLVNGEISEGLSFIQSIDISKYLSGSFEESAVRDVDQKSSRFILITMILDCAKELSNCRKEIFHIKAVDSIRVAIEAGAVGGEVGRIDLSKLDPISMLAAVKAVERSLIRTESINMLLSQIDSLSNLRKLIAEDNWLEVQSIITALYDSTDQFQQCSSLLREEFLIIFGEVEDRELRKQLCASITMCKSSIVGTEYIFEEEVLADLENCIEKIDHSAHKSFETTYLLQTAKILVHLARAVNGHYWEPASLFCSRMSMKELVECCLEDGSRQFREFIQSIDEHANFDALENITVSSAALLHSADLSSVSVSEILVYASYLGVHSLAGEEINRIKNISFDRRCRASLLIGTIKGRVDGSIHSGFDISGIELSSLIRALKYAKLYRKYWSPTIENWEMLATELLNLRLAVLSSESVSSVNRIELSSYLNLEQLNNMIENASEGFPLHEIKFVVDIVNDILMIKGIFDALMSGRPQYVMGVFSAQYVEYEHLSSLLFKSKKLRQRSDKLDRLMFYANLCVLARKALVCHHWDDSAVDKSKQQTKSAERNPGVKQCVEEYRLANKFFSMNKMEGIPPKCLVDEFESMEREFEKRNIMQDFSAVLQAGAITGAPFALNFREISVTSLEAQVKRVRKWEDETGIVDMDLETLFKACSEVLQIRTQVKQIQSSYQRKTHLATTSNRVQDIIATSYINECIDLALTNTAAIASAPFPMIKEWEPVEKVVSRVEVVTSLRSSKQEIGLVTAETYSRTFIARVVSIFMNLSPIISFAKANQAVIDLTYAFQSYSTRVKDLVDRNSKKSTYSSPILEMIYDSTVLYVHLLRAEKLNFYDTPNRNWRQLDLESNHSPRIAQLAESLSTAQFSIQTLIRACLTLDLHPRLVIYVKHLIRIVEDKVTEAELMGQLKKTAGRRRSMVGDMDKNKIQTDEFISTIQRIEAVGIYNEDLQSLHDSSVIICNLRLCMKSQNFEEGFKALMGFVNHGSCKHFGELLSSLNRGQFTIHSVARIEFSHLTLELLDGYWRLLAERALLSGTVVGQRGLLRVSDIGWTALDDVISFSKSHLELSPESMHLLSICFNLRYLRSQLLGMITGVEKQRSDLERKSFDPILSESFGGTSSKAGKLSIVNEDYVQHIIDRALLNIEALSSSNNIAATSINFPVALETITKMQEGLERSFSISDVVKTNVFSEIGLIRQQLDYLSARSQLMIAADMQTIWFTEFGLETRNQFASVIQPAIDAAIKQNWDSGLIHESWCRSLLDTMLSVQLLHEQIRFTGLSAIQPYTAQFESILPFINGVLTQFSQLQKIGNSGVKPEHSKIPKNLIGLANHLQLAITEASNIARFLSILKSDSLTTQINYAGKFIITVSHSTPVMGLNFYNTEYGPYILKLKLMIDKIKVTTFVGRHIQKLTKMYVSMRMHVKQSKFSDALALSKAINVIDDISSIVVDDGKEVQKYCTFLLCRRSLEQSLSCCIIPSFAGWSEFGSMPTLGLAINDSPLAESMENTMKILPNYANDYPEILALMDLGLLFLKLIAAIRTKSWKTLSDVAKAVLNSNNQQEAAPTAAPVKTKGRRHSMLTTGLDNLKSNAAVSSAAAISIESTTTLGIIDSVPTPYRAQFGTLKNSILFHCGETVEQIVSHMRSYLRQPKVVIDNSIRNFVLQIASQAETEIKFAELEALAAAVFKESKISGSPGELVLPKSTIASLESLITILSEHSKLIASCYSLRRAYQTATIMVKVHQALERQEEGLEDLGKCLCLLSFMGSRKRLVQEAKCEDYIYRELVHDEKLLSLDEFTFKASIKEIVRKLKAASSGYSLMLENSVDDEERRGQDGNGAAQFMDEIAAEFLSCSADQIARLRDEFFDDLSLLEQHFTFECHYADYQASLANNYAVGEPGDLDTNGVVYENLAAMVHSLNHFGLVSQACPQGALLSKAIESIYFIRKSQKLGDFEMLGKALHRVEATMVAEQEYQQGRSTTETSETEADARLRKRALELGLTNTIMQENIVDPVVHRPFISAAAVEIDVAKQDYSQRELIIGLRKGINEAVVTLQILADIDIFQTKTSIKPIDLPISLLYYSVNTLAKESIPTSRKAIELHRTAEALLQIRQSINAKKWVHMRHFIESLDLLTMTTSSREEVNIALRIAIVANVIEKSGRAYKVGSIYGHPGKIEDFANIDCSVVEEALKAFGDIADNWKTVDIVMQYHSCVVLHAVRKHFRQSNWMVVRDLAAIALNPARLVAKPLFISAEVEIKLAFDHATFMICYEALSHSCTSGRLKGDVGSIDTTEVSVLVLNKALAVSKAMACPLPEIAALEASAEIVRDIRQAQLMGNWISSSSTNDSVESFSIERAVISTSYSVPPTDLFGNSFDNSSTTGNSSRYLSLHDNNHVPFSSSKLSAFPSIQNEESQPEKQLVVASSIEHTGQITNKFVVQSTLFDSDLCDLYAVGKLKKGEAVIRSVKEIIQHAREVQNSMDLSPLILDELDLAANEVLYREISFNLLRAIRTPGITGEPGALDLSKVKTHDLVEAIAAAEANSDVSRKGGCRWLLRDAKLLLSLRQKTMQHNWKLLSMLFRDVERQNSPDFFDPIDKQPGLPIIMPVWKEIQLVMADMAFEMCLAQFAQEMQNHHEYAAANSRNSSRVVAMIRVLVTSMRAAALYPCQLFAHLVEAQSVALELRVFHNFEVDKNPVDIIHRVGEAKRRDLTAGKVSYMTLLMSDISNMSNVVDKQMYVDSLQNELVNGQLYLMRPLGRIDASVLDVDRLSKALEVAMPLVSVMGSPSEIKLLRVCEAAVAFRAAVKSDNWTAVKDILDNPDNADIMKSALIHDEVDRLRCEIENFEACLLLERTMYLGRYMNVVNLARLECKPRGSIIDRSMSAGEKRRVSQLPHSFFGGLDSLERAMLAGNIVSRRSEILNGYLRAASLIYRIRDKMAQGQWEDLKTLLQDETKYSTLPHFAMEEIRAVKAGMAYRNTMFAVCNALINGCVTGVPGNVIVSTVDAYALQQALNEAANLDMSDTATAVMYDVGTCICRLRNAVKEGRWFSPKADAEEEGLSDGAASPASVARETLHTANASPSKTMAAFMFESIAEEQSVVDDSSSSSAETNYVSSFKPFSSASSAFGRLPQRGRTRSDSESHAHAPMSASVQEIIKEFLLKKDTNYRMLREALSIDENEYESSDKEQDWMLQQWEALLQVEKEVDLVSGELKERKVSSSIVFALENIPSIVKNFAGMQSSAASKRSARSKQLAIDATNSVSSPRESDDDPFNITVLQSALDECLVPSMSRAVDDVSKETERLITTARLILRFRQSLQSFDLDVFKSLLDEAKSMQAQGMLSSHYGLQELSVYRSSAVAVTITKSKLLQNMRNGCVSGRLDAVLTEKIDSSVLYYWLNACSALSQSTKGIVGDLDGYIEEANALIKLRDSVKIGEWSLTKQLLSATVVQSVESVSAIEIQHIRMICKYRDSSVELKSLLEDDVAVMDSALVTRIPPLESCLKEVSEVLSYQSELLPPGGPLLNDRDLRESFRIGTNVLHLWKAIKNNNWNIDGIAASRIHDLERPKDPLLCRLFDSISQHEVARRLDNLHSQLQSLGFEKTAHVQPHRNIRGSIHLSFAASGQGLNPLHAADSSHDNSRHLSHAAVAALAEAVDRAPPVPSVPPNNAQPKKVRRVSVLMDAASAPMQQAALDGAGKTEAKPSNRRRSISEVAPRLMQAAHASSQQQHREFLNPSQSAAAILCREDWSRCPSNVRKLFNIARDRMIDLIIRTRLMFGCKDGAIQLDSEGDIVVPSMCSDLIDIVITDVSRLRSFCVRYGVNLKFSALTEQWLSTAKTLMKCRRALAYNNIEAVILEMLQQGYLGRFRKANFDDRPCHEELDRIERFLFEHMAEKSIRKAIEYLLSTPEVAVSVYYNKYIDALKAVCVLPQSMRQPTLFYTDLMTIARELRSAVAATVLGDLHRLVVNEASVIALTRRDNFSLKDVESSIALLFSLFKQRIVGTKRFRCDLISELVDKKGSKSKQKTNRRGKRSETLSDSASEGKSTKDYLQLLRKDSEEEINSNELRRRLSTGSSESNDSTKPKRSLASLLFGSAIQQQQQQQQQQPLEDDYNNISRQLNVTAALEASDSSSDSDDSSDADPLAAEEQLSATKTNNTADFDPFGAAEDITEDTQDFINRRMRKSMECPGVVFVQSCEISNLCFSTFDNLFSVAQISENSKRITPIWERLLHEVVIFKPPKSQSTSNSNDHSSSATSLSRSYNRVRTLMAQDATQSIGELHSLFDYPTVEESLLESLDQAVRQFSPVFKMHEPLLCFASCVILQVLQLSQSMRPRSQTIKFAIVPLPPFVQEFLLRLRVPEKSETLMRNARKKLTNSSNTTTETKDWYFGNSRKLKKIDYFSFALLIQKAIQYGEEVSRHIEQQRRQQDEHGGSTSAATQAAANRIASTFRLYVESTRTLARRCLQSSYDIKPFSGASNDEVGVDGTDLDAKDEVIGTNESDESHAHAALMGITARVIPLCDKILCMIR